MSCPIRRVSIAICILHLSNSTVRLVSDLLKFQVSTSQFKTLTFQIWKLKSWNIWESTLKSLEIEKLKNPSLEVQQFENLSLNLNLSTNTFKSKE